MSFLSTSAYSSFAQRAIFTVRCTIVFWTVIATLLLLQGQSPVKEYKNGREGSLWGPLDVDDYDKMEMVMGRYSSISAQMFISR